MKIQDKIKQEDKQIKLLEEINRKVSFLNGILALIVWLIVWGIIFK